MKTANDLVLSSLNWRYATKRFDSQKKISGADWELLQASLQLAPSSYGLQPWKFLVVQNPQLRSQLRQASWDQSQVTDCSHFVVLTTLRKMRAEDIARHIQNTATTRGMPVSELAGYQSFMEQTILQGKPEATHLGWNQRQAYIAMGFLLETAALLRVDSTPMEGLDPEKYDQLLGLSETPYQTVAAVALGYRHAEDSYALAKKVRYTADQVVQFMN